jgi:aspartyl-tRNA(Asn)/glutamyl-tRNA(Gln) amidotransferase subunit A
MDTGLDPFSLTIFTALEMFRSRKISPMELTTACLQRINQLNPSLNAFITIMKDSAKNDSKALLNNGEQMFPLFGIPIAVKDLYETKGTVTTAGSRFFREYVPDKDGAVIEKIKQSGALIMGKTNTHEFAFGVTGVNPHFGACHNPWDTTRISGGSSSGSAVAVATGMSLGALGTDTGGSIRIPASLCGVVGLKPTFGRVSLRGIVPLSWNLDHAGPLARSVRDTAVLLQVIAGYDPLDPTSENEQIDDYLIGLGESIRGWKVAFAEGSFFEEADPGVTSAVNEAAKAFESLGAIVTNVDMEFLRELALSNGQMVQADAAAYHRDRLSEHPDWFGADVRERLESGRSQSSTDYSHARRKQSEGRRLMEALFHDYDLLILPTTPITAPIIEGTNAIEQARRLTRFTAPFNLTGLPALSLPCGYDSSGLPIGLQLVSGAWNEARLLQAGHAYERSINGIMRSPTILRS